MLGRLVHRADFEELLGSPPRWRSAHFAMHYVATRASIEPTVVAEPGRTELSTDTSPPLQGSVDNSAAAIALGVLVPKRHARRAVTRNLIRRIVRAAFALNLSRLPAGRWLVRLKAPFSSREFVSAASPRLAAAVREELVRLLASAARRPAGGTA